MKLVILVLMELVSGLFGEAWEHRRRRHRNALMMVLLLASAAVAMLLIVRLDHAPAPTTATSQSAHDSGSQLLASTSIRFGPVEAYGRGGQQLGRHCAMLNSIACDASNVEFDLKRPATSVVASVSGRVMKLKPLTREVTQPEWRAKWGGKPEPGLRWRALSSGLDFTGVLSPLGIARQPIAAHQTFEWPSKGSRIWPDATVRPSIVYRNGSHATVKFQYRAVRGYDLIGRHRLTGRDQL